MVTCATEVLTEPDAADWKLATSVALNGPAEQQSRGSPRVKGTCPFLSQPFGISAVRGLLHPGIGLDPGAASCRVPSEGWQECFGAKRHRICVLT